MYVESFILCGEPPEVRGGELVVGQLADAFVVPEIPFDLDFGAIIELSFEEHDEPGEREVEILQEYSGLPDEPQYRLGSFPAVALQTDKDWSGPRTIVQPLALHLHLWAEFEGFLVVRVDGEEIAERFLRVIVSDVPDSP